MPELTPDEEAFLEAMLKDPDVGREIWKFPLPESFRKKHGIKVPLAIDFKSFTKENYWLRMALAPKDLPPLIINDVSGNVEPYKPTEEIKLEVVSKALVAEMDKPKNSLIAATMS
jgi:hypothetical protein